MQYLSQIRSMLGDGSESSLRHEIQSFAQLDLGLCFGQAAQCDNHEMEIRINSVLSFTNV
jgi:hypothetical protein